MILSSKPRGVSVYFQPEAEILVFLSFYSGSSASPISNILLTNYVFEDSFKKYVLSNAERFDLLKERQIRKD
ncbi:hypothetical protein T4D_7360 [Trichinella pseudospiralis]|uniref:Uncharacterized protein n=1 Tax=Trichinella pseudospiralis TaxID=6337 RepID=A0A0V1G3Z0_TRIPS|nr:hypothetical protein T4D_7360 [Trichinella pseudospiralis]